MFSKPEHSVRRSYVDTLCGQLHYRTAGRGKPLILLHQSAAGSATYERMLPGLAHHRRVYALDTPGFGMSDPLPQDAPEIADFSNAVLEFMDALKIRKASLLGHHTSVAIVCELAVSHPKRVDKLILNGVPSYYGQTPDEIVQKKPRMRNWFRVIPKREDGGHVQDVWEAIRGMAEAGQAFRRPYDEDALKIMHHETISKLLAQEHASKAYAALFRYDIMRRLPMIQAPVLLWTGARDPLLRNQEAVSSKLHRVRSVVGPNGTYFTMHMDADALVKGIIEFLEEANA